MADEEDVLASQLEDVQRHADGTYRIPLGFGDLVLDSVLLAASFEGMSIAILWLTSGLAGIPVDLGELVMSAVFGLFALFMFAVPFVPVALLRAYRRYGQSALVSRFYGAFVAVFFWTLVWLGSSGHKAPWAVFQHLTHRFGGLATLDTPQMLTLVWAFPGSVAVTELYLWVRHKEHRGVA